MLTPTVEQTYWDSLYALHSDVPFSIDFFRATRLTDVAFDFRSTII